MDHLAATQVAYPGRTILISLQKHMVERAGASVPAGTHVAAATIAVAKLVAATGPRVFPIGALAQLGERLICIQEVRSSILLGSTIKSGELRSQKRSGGSFLGFDAKQLCCAAGLRSARSLNWRCATLAACGAAALRVPCPSTGRPRFDLRSKAARGSVAQVVRAHA